MNEEEVPFVSIIVPVLNDEKHIGTCLESLNNIDYPREKYEIIVIDGGSVDNTITIIEKFDRVTLFRSKSGVSHQRNVGIKGAKGTLIALTDSDCYVEKNWLKNNVKYFKDNNIAVIGGPNYTPENSTTLERAAGNILSSKLATGMMAVRYAGKGIKDANETDLIACNNIIRKKVILEVGGFNENLYPNEENELYIKMKQKGYKMLYNSEMVVWHFRKPLFRPFLKQFYSSGKFRAKLTKLYPKSFKIIFLLPSLLILYILIGAIISTLLLTRVLSFSKSNLTLFSNQHFSIDSLLLSFYFGTLILYYLLISFISIKISIEQKDGKLLFILPIGFFLLHLIYGIGFLRGIIVS